MRLLQIRSAFAPTRLLALVGSLSALLTVVLLLVKSSSTVDELDGTVDEGAAWSPEQHIFISSAFDIGGVESSNLTHNIRVIALTHNRDGPYVHAQPPVKCRSDAGEVVQAQWSALGAPMPCKWKDYFLDCNFTRPAASFSLLGDEEGVSLNVPITPPERRRYPLVVCFGRMFFYEQWQIALAAIEVYLHYGVNLFVIPIVSVIEKLHVILQVYEQLGFVHLKHGVLMPRIPAISMYHDPNALTDSLNIITSNTECLYEYRDAAEFMIFADFDDIFIPRHTDSIYDEVLALRQRYPQAPSFRFPWAKTSFKMESTSSSFSISQIFHQLHISSTSDKGKSVVDPKRIRRGVIHGPHFESDYLSNLTEVRLGYDEMFNLHMRDVVRQGNVTTFKENNLYRNLADFDIIERTFFQRLRDNPTAREAFSALPEATPYMDAAARCAEDIYRLRHQRDMCMTPLDCDYRVSDSAPCSVLRPTFDQFDNGKGIVFHFATKKEVVPRPDCDLTY